MKIRLFLSFLCFISLQIHAQDLIPSKQPHLIGYWKFQEKNNLVKATVGNNLTMTGTHTWLNGPAYKDTAIRIGIGSYYTFTHKIKPNGGGTRVNQYTLMFDFRVLNFNKWHTFFQTDSTNKNDGECFIRPKTGSEPGRIGVAATSYTQDSISPNKWYRLMISVNNGNFYRYYLNGNLILEGDTQDLDARFSLGSQILFFADDNQEDDTIDIASLAMFDTCLSAASIAKIGSIDPCVANPPKPNLGNDTSICSYNSVLKNAGSGYSKYLWSTGVKTASANLDLAKLKTGTNKVWVKVTDVNGCDGSDTISITLLQPPIVKLGKDTSVCAVQLVTLNAGTDTSYKYIWKYIPKGNTISTAAKITIDSGGYFMAQATSRQGCIGKDTIHISIYSNPSKPPITVKGSQNICEGSTAELNGPAGYDKYFWNSVSDNSFIYISKTDTIILIVKDLNGCSSPTSDPMIIHVFPNPPAVVLNNKRDTVFCLYDSVILHAKSGYNIYFWQDGAGDSVRSVKAPGYYSVYVRDKNGCISVVSNVVKVTELNSPPKPMITVSGNTSFCNGDSVKLSGPTSYPKYYWNNVSNNRELTIKNNVVYQLRVAGANGCKSPVSDSIAVIVHPVPPKPKLDNTKYFGGIYSLDSGTSYRWYSNNTWLPQYTTRLIYPPFPPPYYYHQVQVKNEFCWSELSDSLWFFYEGVKSFESGSKRLKLLPNPAIGAVSVKLDLNIGDEIPVVHITDLTGKTISTTNPAKQELMDGYILDIRSLKGGMYLVEVVIKNDIFVQKLEIE